MFGFANAFVALPPAADPRHSDAQCADFLAEVYNALLDHVGLSRKTPEPYNLLLTDRWMLLVPRSKRVSRGIDVNAMGFLGCLLLRDSTSRTALEDSGARAVLADVAVAL